MPTPELAETVLVTGASVGIGAATVRRFAGGGHRVVATSRDLTRLRSVTDGLGPHVIARQMDVRDTTAIAELAEQLPDGFDEIGILVNNAGLALGQGPAHVADPSDWETMLDTNCAGLMRMTRALLPAMVDRSVGHIVNIGSVAGTYPYPGGNVYGATKAFVHQFSQNLRSDLHGTGVRVSCIEPGMVAGTEFSLVRYAGDHHRVEALYDGMQALGADDIADVVWWVTSQPAHVNLSVVEVMPTSQSSAAFQIHRRPTDPHRSSGPSAAGARSAQHSAADD